MLTLMLLMLMLQPMIMMLPMLLPHFAKERAMFISTAGGKRRFDLLASMALSRRADQRCGALGRSLQIMAEVVLNVPKRLAVV